MVNIIKYQMSHPIFGGFTVEHRGGINVEPSEIYDLIKRSLQAVARDNGMHAMADLVEDMNLHIHSMDPDENNIVFVCSHCS